MAESIVRNKAFGFAVKIVSLYKYLCDTKHEYVLSKQVLRSGTAICANISEGLYGQTEPDFIAKMSIALKETSETEYWLELLNATGFIDDGMYKDYDAECKEILKMLSSVVNTMKKKQLRVKS